MRKGNNQCQSIFSEGLQAGDEIGAGLSWVDEIGTAGEASLRQRGRNKSNIHEDSGEMC